MTSASVCSGVPSLIASTSSPRISPARGVTSVAPIKTPNQPPGGTSGSSQPGVAPPVTGGVATKPRAFHATAAVPAATAKMRLVEIAEEIVSVLASDPNATVRLAVEISADFPDGASESMKRAVSENARSLGITKRTGSDAVRFQKSDERIRIGTTDVSLDPRNPKAS
jgi:hypothetical protein